MSVRVRLHGIGQVGFDIERKLVGVKFSYINYFMMHLDAFYSYNTRRNTFFTFFLDKRNWLFILTSDI